MLFTTLFLIYTLPQRENLKIPKIPVNIHHITNPYYKTPNSRVFDLRCQISKLIISKSKQIMELAARVSESDLFPDETASTFATIARMTAQELNRNSFAKRFLQVSKSVSEQKEEIEGWEELESHGDQEMENLYGEGGISEKLSQVRTQEDFVEAFGEVMEYVKGQLGLGEETGAGAKGVKGGAKTKKKKEEKEKEVDQQSDEQFVFLDEQTLKRVELLWEIGGKRVCKLEEARVSQFQQVEAISKQMSESETKVLDSVCDFLSNSWVMNRY